MNKVNWWVVGCVVGGVVLIGALISANDDGSVSDGEAYTEIFSGMTKAAPQLSYAYRDCMARYFVSNRGMWNQYADKGAKGVDELIASPKWEPLLNGASAACDTKQDAASGGAAPTAVGGASYLQDALKPLPTCSQYADFWRSYYEAGPRTGPTPAPCSR